MSQGPAASLYLQRQPLQRMPRELRWPPLRWQAPRVRQQRGRLNTRQGAFGRLLQSGQSLQARISLSPHGKVPRHVVAEDHQGTILEATLGITAPEDAVRLAQGLQHGQAEGSNVLEAHRQLQQPRQDHRSWTGPLRVSIRARQKSRDHNTCAELHARPDDQRPDPAQALEGEPGAEGGENEAGREAVHLEAREAAQKVLVDQPPEAGNKTRGACDCDGQHCLDHRAGDGGQTGRNHRTHPLPAPLWCIHAQR
mmetsp:Transcript_98644/g.283529  ORF Transcript_98644/g.283529 Transcript_98644/m.283529 type:complete len:253 (-) Transcript_98644:12-770(-)